MRRTIVTAFAAAAMCAAGAAALPPPAWTNFTTPSGNISCMFLAPPLASRPLVRCDIRSGLHPAPASTRCEFDWGAMELGSTGKGRPGCISDTIAIRNAHPLVYGRTWRRGAFSCTSTVDGLTCRRGTHGFFLSRASWRAF